MHDFAISLNTVIASASRKLNLMAASKRKAVIASLLAPRNDGLPGAASRSRRMVFREVFIYSRPLQTEGAENAGRMNSSFRGSSERSGLCRPESPESITMNWGYGS